VAQSRRIQLTLSSTGVRSSASPTRGPTNAIIHLVAIACRVGVPLPLERFDDLSKTMPFLVNRRPSGKYLMEDFFYAGGLPAVLKQLLPLLHGGALTVNGRSIADNVIDARCDNEDVIRPLSMPLAGEGRTVILFGNLCPDGAVLKQSAASPHLLTHRGRAVVFEDHADLHRRIDEPERRDRRELGAGARAGRPARRAGHAREGRRAHPGAAPQARRQGHGADLGRPDERYVLWAPWCSMSRRSRRSADRWRSCATATRSS